MGKITKGEWNKLFLMGIMGVAMYLISFGIKDVIVANFGDGKLLFIVGVIVVLIVAYKWDLSKYYVIRGK